MPVGDDIHQAVLLEAAAVLEDDLTINLYPADLTETVNGLLHMYMYVIFGQRIHVLHTYANNVWKYTGTILLFYSPFVV